MSSLRTNVWGPTCLCERDEMGRNISLDEARSFKLILASEIVTPARSLAFNVSVTVPRLVAADLHAAEEMAMVWLQNTLPLIIAKATCWNFYEDTWIPFPEELPAASSSAEYGCETEVELRPELQAVIAEVSKHLTEVEAGFNTAKGRLQEWAFQNTAYGFADSLPQAHSVLQILERVLDASADVGTNDALRARNALRHYEELARRKREDNSNYQSALQSLRAFSGGVRFPRSWRRKPHV